MEDKQIVDTFTSHSVKTLYGDMYRIYSLVQKGANMKTTVSWNKLLFARFCEVAILSEDERAVLECRVLKGWSIRKTSMELNMSESTVSRTIKRLREIYDDVQWYDPLLPPRNKNSKTDKYLDEN